MEPKIQCSCGFTPPEDKNPTLSVNAHAGQKGDGHELVKWLIKRCPKHGLIRVTPFTKSCPTCHAPLQQTRKKEDSREEWKGSLNGSQDTRLPADPPRGISRWSR